MRILFDDPFRHVRHREDHRADTRYATKVPQNQVEEGPPADLRHRLRPVGDDAPESGAESPGENHRLDALGGRVGHCVR